MKLLVNTSNLVIGGGIQVGVWFIRQCIDKDLDCYFAISAAIESELSKLGVDTGTSRFKQFAHSPARVKSVREELLDYEKVVSPDAVFTVFGPAYVKFRLPHLSGFADGWLSHSDFSVFRKVFASDFLAGVKLFLTSVYKAYWIRFADAWVFEAKVAADGLAKRARLDREKCHVIANNCSDRFQRTPITEVNTQQPFILLYLTADYAHKGLLNYLHYAEEIHKLAPDFDFRFKISVSPQSPSAQIISEKAKLLGLDSFFDFCGYIPIESAVEVMDSANVVMQTSYLETFSANYPEAMSRKRALIVSNFDFAKNICQDAALYVDPDNYGQVAETVVKLATNDAMYSTLVENGERVLAELPDSDQRFKQYIDLLESLT